MSTNQESAKGIRGQAFGWKNQEHKNKLSFFL
jgi:hypothetical protein